MWGFFSKLASNHSRPRQTLLFQSVGVLALALLVLALETFHIEWSPRGFGWSAAAGFANFMGFLAFFAAIEKARFRPANWTGDASAGTETFRELGNRITALAGCALYAGRSSAH
jgi:hypothetical protein